MFEDLACLHAVERMRHVHEVVGRAFAGADEVGELGPLRVVIGRGRDDRPHMEDVVGVRDQPLAGLSGKIREHAARAWWPCGAG